MWDVLLALPVPPFLRVSPPPCGQRHHLVRRMFHRVTGNAEAMPPASHCTRALTPPLRAISATLHGSVAMTPTTFSSGGVVAFCTACA